MGLVTIITAAVQTVEALDQIKQIFGLEGSPIETWISKVEQLKFTVVDGMNASQVGDLIGKAHKLVDIIVAGCPMKEAIGVSLCKLNPAYDQIVQKAIEAQAFLISLELVKLIQSDDLDDLGNLDQMQKAA